MPKLIPKVTRVRPLLDARSVRFVDALMGSAKFDPSKAALEVGIQSRDVGSFIARKEIRAAVEMARRYRANRLVPQADYVVSRWHAVVRADPRELVEHWRVPCRHCWGHDHRFQYTDIELRDAVTTHRAAQMKLPERDRVEFDDQGGGGYTINRDPWRGPDFIEFMERHRAQAGLPPFELEANSDHSCPRCFGHGEPYAYFHDTRHLSADAATLYLGIETTRHGVKMLTRDKAQAEQLLARHLGALEPEARPVSSTTITEEMADAIIAAYGHTTDAEFSVVSDAPPADAEGAASLGDGGEAKVGAEG